MTHIDVTFQDQSQIDEDHYIPRDRDQHISARHQHHYLCEPLRRQP